MTAARRTGLAADLLADLDRSVGLPRPEPSFKVEVEVLPRTWRWPALSGHALALGPLRLRWAVS